MKHFGANLAGGLNEVDGGTSDISVLTIATGDVFVITDRNNLTSDAQPAGSADGSVNGGLYITGGTADNFITGQATNGLQNSATQLPYLDGKGQEKDLTSYLVGHIDLNGNQLTLRTHSGGTQLTNTITLTGGTGSSSVSAAETNPTNSILPVKFVDNLGQNEFVDSLISQTGGTITPAVTVMGEVMTAITPNNTATLLIDNITVGNPTFATAYATSTSTTIIVDGVEYTGDLVSTAATTGTFTFTSNFPNAIAEDASVTISTQDSTYSPTDVVIGGNLFVTGATTTVNSTDTEFADTFIELGAQASTGSAIGPAKNTGLHHIVTYDADGDATRLAGYQYDQANNKHQISINASGTTLTWANIATEGYITEGDGIDVTAGEVSADIDTTAGLEFTNTGTANAGLIAVNLEAQTATPASLADADGGLAFDNGEIRVAADGIVPGHLQIATAGNEPDSTNTLLSHNGTQFSWVPAPSGTVEKAEITYTKPAAATFVRINNLLADAATNVNTSETHQLGIASGNNLFTISVYETGTNVETQIIPQSVNVFTGAVAATTGANVSATAVKDGDVIIQFGATGADLNGKIVIKR